MNEINLNITIPGLPELIEALKGLGNIQTPTLVAPTPVAPAPVAPAPVAPVPVAPTPVAPTPVAPTPMAPTVQTTAVPTTATQYTADDLARAAVTLMDAGRQAELQALLAKFNVLSLPALDKSQYGAFATELRQMGAQI